MDYISNNDNVTDTADYCYRVANIPTTYDEAVDSLEASRWEKGMTPPGDGQIVGVGGGGEGLRREKRTKWGGNP